MSWHTDVRTFRSRDFSGESASYCAAQMKLLFPSTYFLSTINHQESTSIADCAHLFPCGSQRLDTSIGSGETSKQRRIKMETRQLATCLASRLALTSLIAPHIQNYPRTCCLRLHRRSRTPQSHIYSQRRPRWFTTSTYRLQQQPSSASQPDTPASTPPPTTRPLVSKEESDERLRKIEAGFSSTLADLKLPRRRSAERPSPFPTNAVYGAISSSPPTSMVRPDRQDPPTTLRLSPSLGRSVPVDSARSLDLTKAFKKLEILAGKNRVRADETRQRFHVRRGQVRKTLKVQRWRKVFRQGFEQAVRRVKIMKSQGW